jgi:putative component of membrane protein insertase Oxa1/YidC/SpoIIIJ protein YidD
MNRIIFLFFIFTTFVAAQQESKRWSRTVVSYEIKNADEANNKHETESDLLSSIHWAYKYFVSDLDGDNCPFAPSCSVFFIQAAKQTNLLKASLMFADRFMRDTNIFNRENYIKNSSGKLIDTIENYK